MQTRVRIFNRQGVGLAEVASPNVTRSWVLNEAGVALFFLPRNDPAFNKDIFAFGNLTLIEHDRAGAWAGVLWPSPQAWAWTTGGVNVAAIGAESILRRRISRVKLAAVSKGAAFEEVLGDLNQVDDTLIRAGTIWKGGRASDVDFRFQWVSDVLARWAKAGQMDWGIEPVIDDTKNTLTLEASLVERRGEYRDFALEEGSNIEWTADGAALTEQGEVYNDVTVFRSAVHNNVRDYASASDDASRAAYGLSQIASMGRHSLQHQADATLALRKQHRRTFRLNAIDVNNTFDYLGLGDTLWLHLPSVHWEGIRTRARVIGKEFSDTTGKMILTLDEGVST